MIQTEFPPETLATVDTAELAQTQLSSHTKILHPAKSIAISFYTHAIAESLVLRLLSWALVLHGFVGMYEEMIMIFYVLPKLPEVFQIQNYSSGVFETVFKQSIVVMISALVQSVYGVALLFNHNKMDHKIHYFLAAITLATSFYITSGTKTADDWIEESHLTQVPTVEAILNQKDLPSVLELFYTK